MRLSVIFAALRVVTLAAALPSLRPPLSNDPDPSLSGPLNAPDPSLSGPPNALDLSLSGPPNAPNPSSALQSLLNVPVPSAIRSSLSARDEETNDTIKDRDPSCPGDDARTVQLMDGTQIVFECGNDRWGQDIGQGPWTGVYSWSKCGEICKNYGSDCKAFVWHPKSSKCYLKHAIPTWYWPPYPGVMSGVFKQYYMGPNETNWNARLATPRDSCATPSSMTDSSTSSSSTSTSSSSTSSSSSSSSSATSTSLISSTTSSSSSSTFSPSSTLSSSSTSSSESPASITSPPSSVQVPDINIPGSVTQTANQEEMATMA
ncbi:hypothetical protein B0H67DRAFT_554365 [Lasiosphaeris hirsuta]|uniref:Apple domain-containing protein n=1 Tax=Lasiosphaeris hirsuta TaxID=260670 RepID=A0AA40DWS9_9PEZI|nr:hypothetical protein B0H67DRAFT_554365 [Lasiosphaeris hirsuta]